jgi:hypothetical protein
LGEAPSASGQLPRFAAIATILDSQEESTVRKNWVALAFVAGLVAACSGPAAGAPAAATQAAATQAVATQAAGTQAAATQAAATPVVADASATTGSPAGGPPNTPVACSLITTAAAQTALGEPVAAGTNPGIGENTCIFSGQPSYGIDFVQLTVINPVEFTPTQQSVAGSFTVTPVSGIGDAAYYKKVELPNSGGESDIDLAVRKGQTTFTVSIIHPGAPDGPIIAAEKTLALAAVSLI